MDNLTLVAYATSYGSTQEIAKTIADVLISRGLEVDLQPINKTRSLDDYSAVVMGAPLYMFRWHNDAHRFLNKNRRLLENSIPTAIFGGGPFSTEEGKEFEDANQMLAKELAKHPWFKPASVLLVGGRFNPDTLHFPYSLIPALRQIPAADLRNWDEIRSWADGLVEKLNLRPERSTYKM